MGVLVTTDSSVLDDTWYPEKTLEDGTLISPILLTDYTWTEIEQTFSNESIFLESEYSNIHKFFTTDGTYTYSPNSTTFYLKQNSYNGVGPLAGTYKYYCTYLTKEGLVKESNISEVTDLNNNFTLTLETQSFTFSEEVNFLQLDLQHIIVQAYIENTLVATKVLQVDYGMTEDMAKLALNAANIVASIEGTKLTFDANGITLKNGGISILNKNNERVFYVDDNTGNLYFSGELHSKNGTLGSWLINEYGLYDKDEKVGLYAGGEITHPEDILKSPIRFWAGKYNTEETNPDGKDVYSYNFAVTHEGSLFANQASIKGKIIATDGYIANKFLVGSTDNGIVIFGGNETTDSYIGSTLYSSGSLGYGWKINQDGTAEFNNITARGKIQSSVFEYNKISSVGGSLYIAPTIYINDASNLIELVSISDSIKNYKVTWSLPYANINGVLSDVNGRDWEVGDEIKLDGDILTFKERIELSNIDGVIESITDGTNAIADSEELTTPNSLITIAFSTTKSIEGQFFQPGVILILYGSEARRHGLYLTAAGANSPYMDVYDDSEDNTVKPAVRIGNLSGVTDSNFPEGTLTGYGLYSSNAYLRGQLMLPGAGITNQTELVYGEGNAASPIRIWAGINETGDQITNANFIVTANGYMYAKQGIFEGTVKASNSEFSGTIKAAGIVVEEGSDGLNPISGKDHFFVAYTDHPTNFNDYVLDIGQHGLSIWEGALRAYSDYASNSKSFNTLYGYGTYNNITYEQPLPYFSLADDGEGSELNARIVAHKAHIFTVSGNSGAYKTNSIIFNNGIEFAQSNFTNKETIESSAYYNSETLMQFSLMQLGEKVRGNFQGVNGINLNTPNFVISNKENDWSKDIVEKVFIRGQVKLVNEDSDNLISFNGQNIKEAKDVNGESLGIDFIIGG